MRIALFVAVALALAPLSGAGPEPAGTAAEPLTEEDVVRMSVSGTPPEEILRSIRTREVAFDLSPEMLEELRRAGLGSAILHAMVQRVAELEREAAAATAPAPPAATTPAATPALRVLLNPAADAQAEPSPDRAIVYPAVLIDEQLAQEHGLGSDREGWKITRLALLLACRTGDHVPDQWRSRSPLGRDFVRMPRHRLLALHSGGETIRANKLGVKLRRALAGALGVPVASGPTEFLRLELPEALTAELERGVAHDLFLGLAAEVGDRFILLGGSGQDGLVVGDGVVELAATVVSGSRRGGLLEIEFREPAEAEPPSEPD